MTLTPLDQEKRAVVNSEEAAAHLSMAVKTVQLWASSGKGPIKPVKVGVSVRWRVADIRNLLGVAEAPGVEAPATVLRKPPEWFVPRNKVSCARDLDTK